MKLVKRGNSSEPGPAELRDLAAFKKVTMFFRSDRGQEVIGAFVKRIKSEPFDLVAFEETCLPKGWELTCVSSKPRWFTFEVSGQSYRVSMRGRYHHLQHARS